MKRFSFLLLTLLVSTWIYSQPIGLNLTTLTKANTPSLIVNDPPDPNAGVGTLQVITSSNGGLVSFNKATGASDGILNTSLYTFLGSPLATTVFDPRIRFDTFTNRWFVVALDAGTNNAFMNNNVYVAVSDPDPLTPLSRWQVFQFSSNAGTLAVDFPSIGVDQNSVIIGVKVIDPNGGSDFFGPQTYRDSWVFVIDKAQLINGTLNVTTFTGLDTPFSPTQQGIFCPTGVDNYNANPPAVYVIGSKFDRTQSNGYNSNTLVLFRIPYPITAGVITGPIEVTVPLMPPAASVPTKSTVTALSPTIEALDNRVYSAHLRGLLLFTANTYRTDNTGNGNAAGDRNGIRWYALNNITGTPGIFEIAPVFDNSISNAPLSYFFPSVMSTDPGGVAIAGSVTGANDYINAWFATRSGANTNSAPTLLTASNAMYASFRWGDLSYIGPDPVDPNSVWSILQFTYAYNTWGMQLSQLEVPVVGSA